MNFISFYITNLQQKQVHPFRYGNLFFVYFKNKQIDYQGKKTRRKEECLYNHKRHLYHKKNEKKMGIYAFYKS